MTHFQSDLKTVKSSGSIKALQTVMKSGRFTSDITTTTSFGRNYNWLNMSNKNRVQYRSSSGDIWLNGVSSFSLGVWIKHNNSTPSRLEDGSIVWTDEDQFQQRIYEQPSQLEQEIMLANYEKFKRKASGQKKGSGR